MPAESARGSQDSVRVLLKAISVLELLAESGEEMSLNDISTRLGLNKSTCHRILNTLAARDFVERGAPGAYRLGIGAFMVGSAMARRLDVRERSLPAMQELFEATRETIFLCIRRGNDAVCVERLDGDFAAGHYLKLGGVLPLHIGAAPRVLLAALPDDEIAAYLARPLERNTPETPVDPDELWAEVRRIRAEDGATSRDDVLLGVKAFGAPVYDHTGSVVAALSLSGISAHIPDDDEPRVLTLVREAAAKASTALGHTP